MRATIRNFRRNLKMNIQALGPAQRLAYRWLVCPFLPTAEREFFEGIPGVPGQLYRTERRALHDAILARAPRCAFEIGTFNGGGSTYFSARAFARLGRGRLITLEIDPARHAQAVELYTTRLPGLRPYIEFLLGGDPILFEPYLQAAGAAEFVFLDGAEHAEQSLAQFRFFEPWFQTGSILAMHDWETEKMRLVRQVVTQSPRWKVRQIIGEPDSIGFALYEHL